MLRSGIPYDVWLRQPDRAIETAIAMYVEQDNEDASGDAATPNSGGSYSG